MCELGFFHFIYKTSDFLWQCGSCFETCRQEQGSHQWYHYNDIFAETGFFQMWIIPEHFLEGQQKAKNKKSGHHSAAIEFAVIKRTVELWACCWVHFLCCSPNIVVERTPNMAVTSAVFLRCFVLLGPIAAVFVYKCIYPLTYSCILLGLLVSFS